MSQNNSIDDDDDQILTSKYQPPREVPISELLTRDSDDPSLNEYKKKLLGTAINIIIEPSEPSKLILKRLVLLPDDHAEISFDLAAKSLDKFKDTVVTMKEGSSYRIKLEFYVQRDIISGLRFVQNSYKGPIRTDKSTYMLGIYLQQKKRKILIFNLFCVIKGSRAPKGELQEYISEKELTPSGK